MLPQTFCLLVLLLFFVTISTHGVTLYPVHVILDSAKGTCHHLRCIVIVLPCIDPDTVLPGAALPSVDNPHQHGPVPIYRVQGAARVSLKTQHQWNLFHEDFIFFVTLLGTRRCLPRRCGVLCLSASSQTPHLHLSCKC